MLQFRIAHMLVFNFFFHIRFRMLLTCIIQAAYENCNFALSNEGYYYKNLLYEHNVTLLYQ